MNESGFQPMTEIESHVVDVVSRLSYGDDWQFELCRGDHCFLRVTWAVRDLDPQSPLYDCQGRYGFRSGWTYLATSVNVTRLEDLGDRWLDAFVHELWAAIAELEGHERLERLRVDGVPVWPPHSGEQLQLAPGRIRSTPAGLEHTVRLTRVPSPR